MGLPIVQELWDGIRWIIDFFFNKIPRPLQIFIFLLFLLFFGSLISFTLQIAGVHCNGDKQVVKIDFLDIGTNVALLWEDQKRYFTEETLSICDAHPEKCGNEKDCYFFAEELDNGYYQECNLTNSSANCKYLLKDGNCHTCDNQEICFQDRIVLFFCGSWENVCLDDAYPSGETTAYDSLTGCGSSCYVPDNYLWNSTSGQYECNNQTYCGVNATAISNPVIDQKLLKANAQLLYPTTTKMRNYKSLVYLKCNNDYKPRLTFYGIDLFDYKIWLFFIVIYVLVILYFKFKQFR